MCVKMRHSHFVSKYIFCFIVVAPFTMEVYTIYMVNGIVRNGERIYVNIKNMLE